MTVAALLAVAFPGAELDDPDESYTLTHQAVSLLDGKRREHVVSHVGVFNRHLLVGGVKYPIAGIGSVATAPEFQRRGFATFLLESVHGLLRAHGYTMAALFADDALMEGFYRHVGYIDAPGKWAWPPNLRVCPLVAHRDGGPDLREPLDLCGERPW